MIIKRNEKIIKLLKFDTLITEYQGSIVNEHWSIVYFISFLSPISLYSWKEILSLTWLFVPKAGKGTSPFNIAN